MFGNVIARLKKKEGIEVELVEFTDYIQPNQALENEMLTERFPNNHLPRTFQQRTRNTHQTNRLHCNCTMVFTLKNQKRKLN